VKEGRKKERKTKNDGASVRVKPFSFFDSGMKKRGEKRERERKKSEPDVSKAGRTEEEDRRKKKRTNQTAAGRRTKNKKITTTTTWRNPLHLRRPICFGFGS
jgi:hypothetical protein